MNLKAFSLYTYFFIFILVLYSYLLLCIYKSLRELTLGCITFFSIIS